MFGICRMVLWLIGSLLDHFNPQSDQAWSLSGGLVSKFMGGIVDPLLPEVGKLN